MSVLSIAFNIPEETSDPRRTAQHRESWLQDLQAAAPIPCDVPQQVDLLTISAEGDLMRQVFFHTRPAHGYVEPSVSETASVVAEIDALLANKEDEIVPTMYAFTRARGLVEAAYGEVDRLRVIRKQFGVPAIFPKPIATTDDRGGIRVSWRAENKQVRANFGADAQLRSYVYFESPLAHGVEPLDAEHLAGRFAWLTER